MSFFKNKWYFLLINFIFVHVVFLFHDIQSISTYIDSYFYISSIYIMLALVLFLMKERFFDGITYGLRRFISKSTKQKDFTDDWEDRPLPSEQVNRSFLRAITFQGINLLLIMFALLVYYYTF